MNPSQARLELESLWLAVTDLFGSLNIKACIVPLSARKQGQRSTHSSASYALTLTHSTPFSSRLSR